MKNGDVNWKMRRCEGRALFERAPVLRRQCGLMDQARRVEVFCSLDIFLARLDLELGHMVYEEVDGYEHR